MDEAERIDPQRLVFPQLAGFYARFADYAWAFVRFSAGAVLFPHGVQKVFTLPLSRYTDNIASKGLPLAEFLAMLTYFTEFVAAACLAIGLFTRVAAAMIWVEMLVIMLVFNSANGYFWTKGGIEYALLWWLICTAAIFRGGGRYSVDRLLPKEF